MRILGPKPEPSVPSTALGFGTGVDSFRVPVKPTQGLCEIAFAPADFFYMGVTFSFPAQPAVALALVWRVP